jgi:recombination protein RecA
MHLDTVIQEIQQRFGRRALGRGVSHTSRAARVIETGFAQLDDALGGGLPRGTVVEFLGHLTSGKTTLALKCLAQAQAQAQSAWVCYVDPARAFDPEYAHRCGLDLSRLVISFPDDQEQTLAVAEALATADGIAAVVLDAGGGRAGAALDRCVPDAAFLRRILSGARGARSAVLIVLHDEAAPSGSSLPHFASIRLRTVREKWIWHHGDVRGCEVRVEVLKSRLGPSGRSVLLTLPEIFEPQGGQA